MVKVSGWYDFSWIISYIRHEAGFRNQYGLLTWVLLLCVLTAIIPAIIRRWKLISTIERLPGPVAWPLIGNALLFNVSPRELFSVFIKVCCYEEGLTRLWFGFDPNVFLYKANLVEILLSSRKHIDKGWAYRFIQPWLGLGLLTSTGKKWQSRRKLLTPTFHFKILEDFVEVFNRQSMKLVEILSKDNTIVAAIDIFPFISRCALDTICETAMGVNLNTQDEPESKYLQSVSIINGLIQHRASRPWLFPDFLYRILGPHKKFYQTLQFLHGFTNDAISRRKQQRCENDLNNNEEKSVELKRKRLAFLDLLLEYSANGTYQLSDEEIREEVDTFMFEGHDTTTASLNFTLYLFGLHPDIQARVQEELDGVFGESERAITSEDLGKLKYLECCIKESLRLFPSVPIHSRTVTEDLQLDRYLIPAGTTLQVIQYQLHRDPTYFPDPEAFLPERFTPENSSGRHPYAYIPFSAGPRNCIGQKFAMMEEKIILCNMLRHFHIESQVPREDLYVIGELILKPENGNILKLSPRTRITTHEE